MIRINFPYNYIPERKYMIDILFGEFLGLKYNINVKDGANDYDIILENGNKIIIKDLFFYNFKDGSDYLDKKNIPGKIKFLKNQFIVEKNIPVIYGNDEFKVKEDEIICGIDIFASSFFMLTRWEEYVNKKRDMHNRFPAAESLSYKSNFLDRPIVNEYVEMLWNMLKYLGYNQKRKEKKYELVLTHDVDNIFKWKNFRLFVRNIAGDVIKRKNVPLALENIRQYFGKNPYDMFDFLMDLSEKKGIKSHFFFMSGGSSKFDNNYSINQPFLKKIREKIVSREHLIGFHPSYNSYNNQKQWEEEYSNLSTEVLQKVKIGRQHFLRFEVPTTWQIWEDNNMKWDSTLTYPEKEGFRCGTGDEFSVFNILSRKKLNLKEKPLIIMEGTLQNPNYRGLSPIEALKVFKYYFKITKKYESKFTLLWHNSSFDEEGGWLGWKEIYNEIMKLLN